MSGAGGGADRRTSTRISTHQHVVFSDGRALGPLRTGTAVDRSTGGLRILTAFPEPLGSTIQIELRNSTGAGVTLLEGRVMHVVPAENGQYAMGIRLAARPLRPPAPTRVAGGARTSRRNPSTPSRLDVSVGGPLEVGGSAAAAMSNDAVTFRRVETRGRSGSWAALAAILALLLILVFLIVEAMKEQRRNADSRDHGETRGRSPVTRVDLADVVPLPIAAVRDAAASFAPVVSHEFVGDDRGPLNAVYRQVRAPGGDALELLGESARAALGEGSAQAHEWPKRRMTPERFSTMLDYAVDAAARGERGLAMAVIRRALRDAGDLAPAWHQVGQDLLESIRSGSQENSLQPLSEWIAFDAARPARGAERIAGMRVEVDAGDYTLRVWRDDSLLAEFPVGLGGATPRGTFRIANKVSDPAWYPADGRVVPAGDPANPIGAQWMGLAGGPGATGIGIHPTEQASSIGRDASRGCVRMRPLDAEALYRLVPIGSPVSIHD